MNFKQRNCLKRRKTVIKDDVLNGFNRTTVQ